MAVSRTLRFTVLARDGFECVYCHATDKPLEVDHVRPKALGGADAPENLVAACEDCNAGKSAAHLGDMDSVPRPIVLHERAVLIQRLSDAETKVRDQEDEINRMRKYIDRQHKYRISQRERLSAVEALLHVYTARPFDESAFTDTAAPDDE